MFNKNAVETGGYYDRLDGKRVAAYNMSSSDFIPVEPNVEYTHNAPTTRNTHLTYWDENFNFLGGLLLQASATVFKIDNPNIKFIKVGLLNVELHGYMLAKKYQFPDSYVPYNLTSALFNNKNGM